MKNRILLEIFNPLTNEHLAISKGIILLIFTLIMVFIKDY
jgi:hypothetical protein